MDKETIFNIFPICENRIITKIGFRAHEYTGSDEDKAKFLLSQVEKDFKEAIFIEVPSSFRVKYPDGTEISGLTHERYNNLLHNGTDGILYESIFQLFKALKNPLLISTTVIDGEIKITKQKKYESYPKTGFTERIVERVPNHYLSEFMTEAGFDLGTLINSDFIEAIKLLFNNQKYASSIKLLMSAIDTFAFIEFGDVSGNFKNWLSKYCNLSPLGISVEELWEYRNSIIHMTNPYSRKVLNKQVQKLSFYVAGEDVDFMTSDGEAKYFNLVTLNYEINQGVENWCNSYNVEREKFADFCDRYDLIISDSRYGIIE